MRWHQGSGRGRRRDWLVDSTHRVRSRRRAYVGLERLECRGLPGKPVDYEHQLVDANDDRVSSLVVGEEVFVDPQWMATGLSPPSDQYDVRFTVDGVSLCPASPENGMSRRLGYYEPYRR